MNLIHDGSMYSLDHTCACVDGILGCGGGSVNFCMSIKYFQCKNNNLIGVRLLCLLYIIRLVNVHSHIT